MLRTSATTADQFPPSTLNKLNATSAILQMIRTYCSGSHSSSPYWAAIRTLGTYPASRAMVRNTTSFYSPAGTSTQLWLFGFSFLLHGGKIRIKCLLNTSRAGMDPTPQKTAGDGAALLAPAYAEIRDAF